MALIYVLIKQTFITKLEVEELSDQSLDRMYVEENVLTNTDRFLEGHMTGRWLLLSNCQLSLELMADESLENR